MNISPSSPEPGDIVRTPEFEVPAHLTPRVCALGGGHGLYGSLSALKHVTTDLTAVVTVADDGGSSGRLRQEFGVVPPGDLRMALSALCDDSNWGRTWRDVMQHRFTSDAPDAEGALNQHALGNLLIVTLWQLLGNTVAGLDWAGALLHARGRVLPMSCTPLVIEAQSRTLNAQGVETREHIVGQVNVAQATEVSHVTLTPADAEACPEAVQSILDADWVILGPGSWYTSVLPHLLLPGIREALLKTSAQICLVMNLELEDKETMGLSAAEHLQILRNYAPEFRLNAVIADSDGMGEPTELEEIAAQMGAEVSWVSVRSSQDRNVHDALRLGAAYQDLFRRHI
ncbi:MULTISPECIES: gluconeogenesis factor YvcK family protein [Rothia]|uniref:gluconeogenesis factor YvcK family protein n=1 Tax=Rothia TaxID=32207 RepID=UPI000925C05E|nr:gluconeogenesis factor YvcK family protein [Rothia sp. ND6WE1A]SIL72678.1 LPPG:FO 2-phospho-L-lactate transferase [Mycobacteroides abscessus subsp. abscessus]